jgi:hypothetical protein
MKQGRQATPSRRWSWRNLMIIAVVWIVAFLNGMNIKALYPPKTIHPKVFDKFGVQEIHPTAAGGREWYVNMRDPKSDPYCPSTFCEFHLMFELNIE